VVESTSAAAGGIGALLTGQYDGILGVARLEDLEKAFAMLPAFSLPVAAVPFAATPVAQEAPRTCAAALATAAIDIEWVLGLLGVAGGAAAPVGDYLPLLREAAEMFTPQALAAVADGLGIEGGLTGAAGTLAEDAPPVEVTAAMAAEYLTRGGKFLRPFICLASFDAVRADLEGGRSAASVAIDRASVKAAAVAIEVFHKASLVHDDIEDDDHMRYGRPTLHVERGVPAAINVGDYLLGIGYRIVSALPGADAGTLADVVRILADAHVRLARGQGAELWWRDARDKRLSPAEALAIYGLKTSPAFEAAIAMGIRLAGPAPADICSVDRYALHVGTGFQVLNDLKDWSGDLENRRVAAGDLLGGRPTLMWALALERLSAADAERLCRLAAEAAARASDGESIAGLVAEVRELYDRADVFTRAAAVVDDQRARAAAALAACRFSRLRDVLELLLDLAVPEQAAAGFIGR
jgi:geranylgeranyl pyrophosphate synthase